MPPATEAVAPPTNIINDINMSVAGLANSQLIVVKPAVLPLIPSNNETAIFIDEKNYKNKFEEYLSDSDNKRWSEIAKAGREYALNELNNDKAVESLIQLMKEFIK